MALTKEQVEAAILETATNIESIQMAIVTFGYNARSLDNIFKRNFGNLSNDDRAMMYLSFFEYYISNFDGIYQGVGLIDIGYNSISINKIIQQSNFVDNIKGDLAKIIDGINVNIANANMFEFSMICFDKDFNAIYTPLSVNMNENEVSGMRELLASKYNIYCESIAEFLRDISGALDEINKSLVNILENTTWQ